MMPRAAAFVIPGDIEQKTGGYIYERSLLLALRAAGREVAHIEAPDSFPDPSAQDILQTLAALTAVPKTAPLIVDGLVFGSVSTDVLRALPMPIVAMIHHPLGLETGLSVDRAAFLLQREADNLAYADHVVVPSGHTADILRADFGVPESRISIAFPGFDRPQMARQPETPPLILSVGLLAARKGHDVLLQALAGIVDLDWRTEIVGGPHDPAVAAALITQRDALGLSGRVRFAGLLSDAEVQDRYHRAAIFALATRYEGYGMVFSEAVSHALPIVTCRTGAVPETVPKDAGWLVPPDDPAAFSQALRQVLSDPDRQDRMAQAAFKAAANLPAWSDTAAVMGDVLDRVTKRI